jgi:hypothetical protein
MAKIKPATRKDPFALQLVNLSIGKDAPVDETAFGID